MHYIILVVAVDEEEDYDNTTIVKWEIYVLNNHKDPAYKQNMWKQLSLCALFLHKVLYAGFWFLRRALISHMFDVILVCILSHSRLYVHISVLYDYVAHPTS